MASKDLVEASERGSYVMRKIDNTLSSTPPKTKSPNIIAPLSHTQTLLPLQHLRRLCLQHHRVQLPIRVGAGLERESNLLGY